MSETQTTGSTVTAGPTTAGPTTTDTTDTTEATGNGGGDMTLLPEEISVLASLRQSANDVVNEVGQIEVRKARLLGSLSEIEARAQNVLNTAGTRLEIPEGKPWQVTPDGKVVLLPDGVPGTGGPMPETGV